MSPIMTELEDANRQAGIATAFCSVMIGLMVNYILGRVGDLARAANQARRARLSYSGVLGTVVTERILDILTLAVGLAASVLVLSAPQRARVVQDMLIPAKEALDPIGLVLILAGVALLGWRVLFRSPLRGKLAPVWHSFADGVLTVMRSPRKVMLIATTLAMWLLYGLTAWIPLAMFGLSSTYDLSLVDAMVIMLIGVLGVVVPAPGGIGSYHYITRLTLTSFYGVPAALATSYAVFVHGAQLCFYIAIGMLVILFQNTPLSRIKEMASHRG